jgi:hypothetical protein
MKKSYRILEELCTRSTMTIQQFINEQRSNFLLEHLLTSLINSQSALKGVCICCIKSVYSILLNLASTSMYFKFT